MNYPDRGATIYQDLIYLLFFICTNFFILLVLCGIVFIVMLKCGYKSITIKFNKRNKLLKKIRHSQKIKEKSYLNKLDKKLKQK